VICLISADREFSIEIGSVADLKIRNLDIVNPNPFGIILILIPAHNNGLFNCNPKLK
jgi:hypothetical protein